MYFLPSEESSPSVQAWHTVLLPDKGSKSLQTFPEESLHIPCFSLHLFSQDFPSSEGTWSGLEHDVHFSYPGEFVHAEQPAIFCVHVLFVVDYAVKFPLSSVPSHSHFAEELLHKKNLSL